MTTKQVKVASLGATKASAYDAAGNRYFIPERFRANIAVGNYMLVIKRHFEQSTERNPDGTVKMDAATGQPVLVNKPFDREEVTMVGDFKATTLAQHEDRINNGVADAIVTAEIKTLHKQYSLVDAEQAVS